MTTDWHTAAAAQRQAGSQGRDGINLKDFSVFLLSLGRLELRGSAPREREKEIRMMMIIIVTKMG
jgi:hypothetical protein